MQSNLSLQHLWRVVQTATSAIDDAVQRLRTENPEITMEDALTYMRSQDRNNNTPEPTLILITVWLEQVRRDASRPNVPPPPTHDWRLQSTREELTFPPGAR